MSDETNTNYNALNIYIQKPTDYELKIYKPLLLGSTRIVEIPKNVQKEGIYRIIAALFWPITALYQKATYYDKDTSADILAAMAKGSSESTNPKIKAVADKLYSKMLKNKDQDPKLQELLSQVTQKLATEKQLGELSAKDKQSIEEETQFIKTFMNQNKDVFADESINTQSIMYDLWRNLHIMSLRLSDNQLITLGAQDELAPKRCENLLNAFELVAKECGEWEDFEEIVNRGKSDIQNAQEDVEKLKEIATKTLTLLNTSKKDSKTIKVLRAMTQGNQFTIIAPQNNMVELKYAPPKDVYTRIPLTVTFASNTITVTATTTYTLCPLEKKEPIITVKATLDHVYDKDMNVCEETRLTTNEVDVSQIPPELQTKAKLKLNVNLTV